MIKYDGYKFSEIIKLIGHQFSLLEIEYYYYDYDYDEYVKAKRPELILSTKNIKEIKSSHYFSTFWTAKAEGEEYYLSSYKQSDKDESSVISENNFLSPIFKMVGSYILDNNELHKWLVFNGIDEKTLLSLKQEIEIKGKFLFRGIPNVQVEDGRTVSYSYQDLKINEDDLDKALSEISDDLIREQIRQAIKESSRFIY